MTRIQWRRDTAAAWATANPILAEGEAGFETNTLKVKVGNGASAWNSLAYLTAPGAELLANKGAANGYASLDSNGKVPGAQLPNSIMTYEGLHNVSTNTPTLSDATGDAGATYRISVAGTRNYGSGNLTLNVGDYLIHSGSIWQVADTTDAVSSVAGKTGSVTLTKTDVGLANVDNTSDATKNAAAAALTNKTAVTSTGTVTGLQLAATATTGTAPLTVASTTAVSNLNADMVDGVHATDLGRLVCTTANGNVNAADGANTWARIATYSTGTTQYADGLFMYAVTCMSSGTNESAIISVFIRANGTGSNPSPNLKMIAHSGGSHLGVDSFKIVSDGWSSDQILWMNKKATYGRFAFYEISELSHPSLSVVYNNNAAWQAAVPTGTVNNVSTDGVSSGLKITAPSFVGSIAACTGLPVAGISATGTRNSTTYLRGDGTWAATSGGISTGKAIAMAMVFG